MAGKPRWGYSRKGLAAEWMAVTAQNGLQYLQARLQHTGVLPNGEIKTLPGNKKLQQVTRKKKNEAKWISGEQMAEGVKPKKQQEESLPPKTTKQQIVGSKCYTDNKNEASRGNLGNYRSVNCTSACTKLIGMIIKNRTSHNTAQCACLRGKPCH